jgi:hypothetical protein
LASDTSASSGTARGSASAGAIISQLSGCRGTKTMS